MSLPLFSQAADDLGASRIPASSHERRVYDFIRDHKGYKNPISIRLLHAATGLSERVIKDAVAELVVTHKIMIGALRSSGDSAGYFMIESADDQEVAAKAYKAQIIAMLRRLRVIQSPHKVREWLGQQVTDL